MQFHTMNHTLIDIYNIRNIQSIKLYDMVVSKTPKLVIIPALFVVYDGGKEINLCAKDKYFSTLVKKVVQVYKDEKDNILEDSLIDPFHIHEHIQIDSHSQEVLSSGTLENIHELYQFYDKKESYEGSLLFQKDEVDLLLPIIKYHLIEMFSHTDKTIQFEEKCTGYRDYYIIDGFLNGIPQAIPFTYDKVDNDTSIFTIGSLLENHDSIRVVLHFAQDKIIVQVSLGSYDIVGDFTYAISDGVVKAISDIQKGNLTIQYQNMDLPMCDNEYLNLANFDRPTALQWFQLPWDAYYGVHSHIEDISDTEKIVEISNMYLGCCGQSFMRKEYFSKHYCRQSATGALRENTSLSEVIKNTMGVCISGQEGIYLIETAFLDTLQKDGYYDERLSNRYFYHIVKNKKGIKNICGKSMIAVSKADGIFSNGDTMNTSLMLKIVRGK